MECILYEKNKLTLIVKRGKKENFRVASPEVFPFSVD